MAKVTIDSKTDLNAIGGSADRASEYYLDATASADQSFKNRTSGQESNALSAFVDKVNNLSTYVFSIYPNLLTILNKSITTYTGDVEGEGFSGDVIYTSDGGITNIKNWLTEQRYHSILEKEAAIDLKIFGAKAALAMEPNPVEVVHEPYQITHEARVELGVLARKRETTHNNLLSHMRSFRGQLETLEGDLTSVGTYLSNALALAQAPIEILVGWLTSGKLTTDNMDIIDSVQDKGDYMMLDVLLDEGDDKIGFYAKLGTVDTTHVSQAMMDKTYSRIYENSDSTMIIYYKEDDEVKAKEVPALQAFFDTLGEQEQSKAKGYLEKLSVSGARLAAAMSAGAVKMMPNFSDGPEQYTAQWNALQASGELSDINTSLSKMGDLSALFDSAAVLGIGGYSRKTNDHTELRRSRLVDLEKTDDGYAWNRVTYQQLGIDSADYKEIGRKHVSAKYTQDGVVESGQEGYAAYQKLQAKKEEAVKDLFKNAFIGTVNLVSPGMGSVISLVSEMSGVDSISSSLSVGNDMADTAFGENYNGAAKKTVSATKEVFKFVESLYGISDEEKEIKDDIKRSLFDVGGSTTDATGSDVLAKKDITYDLQAILQSHDMEENGLRSFVYREYGDEKILSSFDNKIADAPTNDSVSNWWDNFLPKDEDMVDSTQEANMTKETRDFLAGKSDKTITEVGEDNIWQGLNIISQESRDYGMESSDWTGEYLSKNTEAFNQLVGNQ